MKYLWANILGALIFAGVNLAVFVLKKDKFKVIRNIALVVICIILLSFKTIEYAYYQIMGMHHKVPMELSQIAYFLFPISYLVSRKTQKMLPIGAFTALLAGVFFNVGWIASAKTFFERDTVYQLITASVFHNALYFGGMLVLSTIKLPSKQFWHMPIGLAQIVCWHYLMHAVLVNDKDVVLKNVCEAKILDYVWPNISQNTIFVVTYYVVVLLGLGVLIALFYYSNYLFNKNNTIGKIEECNYS
ncbi:MAG: hypothetical protein EOM87_02530 [Clostridia bacterium]|nr:hypothetical protein [Clostridia bacterium]